MWLQVVECRQQASWLPQDTGKVQHASLRLLQFVLSFQVCVPPCLAQAASSTLLASSAAASQSPSWTAQAVSPGPLAF